MPNSDAFEKIFAAGKVAIVRAWMRECLERWFVSNDARSFKPFLHLYRSYMEPEEVIAAIYRELGSSADLESERTATGLFRDALAELLLEPITFEEAPFVYETLLRAGGLIRANEVAEAMAKLMRAKRLSSDVSFIDQRGQPVAFNFFRTAVYEMIRAGYQTQASTHFFSLALENIEQDISLFPVIFRAVLERLPEQRFDIAMEVSEQMTSYLHSRLEYEDYDLACQELKVQFSVKGGQQFWDMSEEKQRLFATTPAVVLIEDDDVNDDLEQESSIVTNLSRPSSALGYSKSQTIDDVTKGQASRQNWSDARIEDVAREFRRSARGS